MQAPHGNGEALSTDSDGNVDNGGLRLSVYDLLKNGFVTHEVNTEAACTSY